MMRTTDEIAYHLEFFGYRIERKDYALEAHLALHAEKNNIFFHKKFDNFINFLSILTVENALNDRIMNFINNANSQLTIAKVHVENEKDRLSLSFEAVFIGAYTKELFGTFFECFENDIKKFQSLEDFEQVFLW